MKKLNRKYNQVQYAEKVYTEGFSDPFNKKTISYETYLLGLYLRDYEGFKPKARKKFIYDFLKKNDPTFNEVTDFLYVEKILKRISNKKYHLKEIGFVPIFDSEVNYLKELDIDERYKRILFVFLVFGKLSQAARRKNKEDENETQEGEVAQEKKYSCSFVSSQALPLQELKKQSCVNFSKSFTIQKVLYYLVTEKKFIWLSDKDCSYRNIFEESIDRINEKVVYEITDYVNLGYYWDKIQGDKRIKFCEKCGEIFKDVSKNQQRIYCRACTKTNSSLNERGLKQKICPQCGQPFDTFSNIPYSALVLCPTCRTLRNAPQQVKTLICDKCGKEFEIGSKANHKTLCDECQREKIRLYDRERKKKTVSIP